MAVTMNGASVILFLFSFVNVVLLQGTGSGTNGSLRVCVVEGRGSYKRAAKYCPILDQEKSGIECVLGTDRLDCLRRIGKNTVDFGVFHPEDLVAAQWAELDVLVTNKAKNRAKPFERNIVAVVNREILENRPANLQAILRNTTLCHPGVGLEDIRPLSDTLSGYLESILIERSCDPKLSLTENRIKAMAGFFGKACKAGSWVPDKKRDAELKNLYPSLCAACDSKCNVYDRYWGDSGALECLHEGAGDVTWSELNDVTTFFQKTSDDNLHKFSYLCRDGSSQPMQNNTNPCVWLNRPWPVIVSKRKAAEDVSKLIQSLTTSSAVDNHWQSALVALLEVMPTLLEEMQPPLPPMDYLATAPGFREAYSQSGCDPPRHITICTSSPLEHNKCTWMTEAASVYGVVPSLQCSLRNSTEQCLACVRDQRCDVTLAHAHTSLQAIRDYSLTPVLYEASPIVDQLHTVVAYVREGAQLTKMADLRGKRAAFPRFDGTTWHSVLRHLMNTEKKSCSNIINEYFSEICAPGIEKYNVSAEIVEKYTKNCYKDGNNVIDGEIQALRSLVEENSDVAFISMHTYNMYIAKHIEESWAMDPVKIVPVCSDENKMYCFISWSSIGYVYASKNITSMRRQEVINVLTKMDQLFGKRPPFHTPMFSMYGPFNHKLDVLFHNNTRNLITENMFSTIPYNKIPFNFERTLTSSTIDSCHLSDLTNGFGAKSVPTFLISMVSLVVLFVNS